MCPRQILELGKQFNLMIRLQNILKASLQDVLKMSWRRFCKTSWRHLENVLKTSWQDVLKMSWRRLENVLKTSWRRMAKANILVLIKTSSEDEDEMGLQDVFKTSSSRRMFPRLTEAWAGQDTGSCSYMTPKIEKAIALIIKVKEMIRFTILLKSFI